MKNDNKKNIDATKLSTLYEGNDWIKQGLIFGFLMYALMNIISPLIWQEQISQTALLVGIPIWIIAGLAMGYVMKTAFKNS